jgi:hypothetical protein
VNIVNPKAVILYAKIGSVFYPIACAKDVTITTTSDLYELAPRSSTIFKEYEYGRVSGEISGSGLSTLEADEFNNSLFDVLGTQLNSVKWLAKFSMTDGLGKFKVMECNVLVKELSITGSSTAFSSYTYTLQISGEITISSSFVSNTNPKIRTYEHTASTIESSKFIPSTGTTATILLVYINGLSKKINIYPDGYAADEVQWRADNSTLYFGTNLQIGDKLKVIYVDL